jgi:hypothetical protein
MIVGQNKRQCNNIDVNNIQTIQTTNTNINDTTNIIQRQRQQRQQMATEVTVELLWQDGSPLTKKLKVFANKRVSN